MRFRKRPVAIDAVQWLGDLNAIFEAFGERFLLDGSTLLIVTLEGTMDCRLNDWLIRGVNGEFYPCKPDIFEKTYIQHDTTLEGRVRTLMADVAYPPRRFEYEAERQFLSGAFECDGQTWRTRKWYISEHATDSEILQTMLKVALTSAEHEVREAFLYRGRPIYGPHLSKDQLWELAEHEDHRAEPIGQPTVSSPPGVGSDSQGTTP